MPTARSAPFVAVVLALATSASAATAPLPPVPNVRELVRQRGNAVVRVECREYYPHGLLRRAGRLLNPFPLRRTIPDAFSFALFVPSIVLPGLRKHLGSAVLFDAKGRLLTNAHVVRDADRITVRLRDAQKVQRSFRATVAGLDRQADIALLRIAPGKNTLVTAPLGDSEELQRGDWVVAIGNPLDLTGSASAGIVSGLHRVVGAHSLEDHIQVDASLNPGNSGGPLLNTRGEVVGIVSLGIFPSNGIGFAVPTGLIGPFLDNLEQHGRPLRGHLGVSLRNITPELARKKRLDVDSGVLVTGVKWLSPAWDGGIRDGDILVSYDGRAAKTARVVQMAALRTAPGTRVDVQVRREGKPVRCRVRVGERRKPFSIF